MQIVILRRQTKQRKMILEKLKKAKTHPTANIIFRMVKKRIPSISFGTVYRNLNLLRDEGSILEIACGKYSCRYDGDTTDHHHFFCLKCNEIFDLPGSLVGNLDKQVCKDAGFEGKYHRINFYGYCKRCGVN